MHTYSNSKDYNKWKVTVWNKEYLHRVKVIQKNMNQKYKRIRYRRNGQKEMGTIDQETLGEGIY